jgi:hemolysin activation/secretion protein
MDNIIINRYSFRFEKEEIILMQIKQGLIFLLFLMALLPLVGQAQTAYTPMRFTVSGFVVTGDNPIGDQAQKVLQSYLGEQYGLDGLSAAADALEQEINKQGYSFHRVSLPPQQLTSGTVELNVVRFTIGAVNVTGNKFFSEQNIRNSLPELSVGGTPNTKELSRSLKLANNHASKNVLLKFKEGNEADTIDAELTVKDRNPQIFFLTLDNSGSKDTKEFRSTFGYQNGNLFNRDHALTATLTVAPEDPDSTKQLGLNYHIPLYAHGANLDFLFSDSEVNSGEVGSGVAITGKGSVYGFTYSRPMLTDTNFNHQWSAGFQNKLFENELTSGGLTSNADVQSFPLEIGYGFSYAAKSSSFSGNINYDLNIDSGSKNTDEDYQVVRPGAKNDWTAIRYSLAYDRIFSQDWLFHAGLSGQNSDDLLISGEQFGVGGSSTLRGFEERSVTGDSGYQTSFEVWTPAIYKVRYLVFIDQAKVKYNDGEDYNLSSYGVGLRWSWKEQLSISLDYAVINKGGGPDTTINQDGDDKAHFNLIYRF